MTNLILIGITLIIFFLIYINSKERYKGGRNGALIQLVAKGPQDLYLTGY